jgi:type I restriction enzyme S subunit
MAGKKKGGSERLSGRQIELELPAVVEEAVTAGKFSTEKFVECFPIMVEAAGGTKRLRKMVVALALRGRLCPQDPAQRPARRELEEATRDRSWRIEERPSKPKLDPKIEALAGVTPIPPGWIECRLDDCAQLINGRAYAQDELLNAGTPVIRIQNLNGGNDWYYSDLSLPERQYCQKGDLLFAWSASFGPYIWDRPRAIYHYHIWKLNLSRALDKRFFYFSLLHITEVVREQSHGLAMLHMTKGQMERWPVLLPPLAEQKRIVARVDQLMALIDELERKLVRKREVAARFTKASLEALKTAEGPEEFEQVWRRVVDNWENVIDRPEKLDELRRTVLNLAVKGGLSRRQSDEPSTTLAKEEQAVSALPFMLRDGWGCRFLGDVVDARLGKMLDKVRNRGEPYPYLRNTNVHWFRFELESVKRMLFSEDELGEYALKAGDVLVCEGGHGIGRTAVWDGSREPIMFQKALHRLRPSATLDSHFLSYQLRVADESGDLRRYYTGAGIAHLTGRSLARFPVVLPPLAEQKRIVVKVSHMMKLCDQLEAVLRRCNDRASKLVDAALEEAVS